MAKQIPGETSPEAMPTTTGLRTWGAQVRIASFIFLLVLLGCYVGRAQDGVDTIVAPYAAWELARHGSWDVSKYELLGQYRPHHLVQQPDGRWMTTRPGTALAAVPVILPLAVWREEAFSRKTMCFLARTASALHVAAAAALFYLMCMRLIPSQALLATVLFALGTSMLSIAGTALWMHGPATFWLVVALYLMVCTSPGSWRVGLAIGLALGFAQFIRPTTALFTISGLAALLVLRQYRRFAGVALGLVLPVTCYMAYNKAYLGHSTLGGYNVPDWGQVSSIWESLAGLLVSPSRGLFVYTPAFLLVPIGIWAVLRRPGLLQSSQRTIVLFWGLGVVATTLFYAILWPCWWGGWCYGPRFFCECVPALCLLFAFGAERFSSWPGRSAVAGLVGLAIIIHVAGVFSGSCDWHARHVHDAPNQYLFSVRDSQIEASLRHAIWNAKGDR